MVGEWINVKDRLPEKPFENYLVVFSDGIVSMVRLIKDSSDEPTYFDTLGEVTHWMLLPKPPKQ
jgi:hypothetical protein